MLQTIADTTPKRRSYRACVSAACLTVGKNIWTITRRLWVFLLIAALANAALSVISMRISSLAVQQVQEEELAVGTGACLLLVLVSQLLVCSGAFSFINGKKLSWNVWRGTKTLAVWLAIGIVCLLIIGGAVYIIVTGDKPLRLDQVSMRIAAVLAVVLLVAAVFSVPLVYSLVRYMAYPDTALRSAVGREYVTGARHWWRIFATCFLIGLCLIIAQLVAQLPQYVLITANLMSIKGITTYGDAAGLPAHFDYIMALTTFITSIAILYLSIIAYMGYYYLCNSIIAIQEEKSALMAKQTEENVPAKQR